MTLPVLLVSVAALAVAGIPHCATMCGVPCAAVLSHRSAGDRWSFHIGRLLGYVAVGAGLAAGSAYLGDMAMTTRSLGPLWTAWHLLGLLWGLWLLSTGRQPLWILKWSAAPTQVAFLAVGAVQMTGGQSWAGGVGAPSRKGGPSAWLGLAGIAWAAWPCGLLHSAFLVASLGNGPIEGGLLMAVFAALTSVGLIAAPGAWRRMISAGYGPPLTRAAGAMLALACLWTLGERSGIVAWCVSHL